MLLNLTSVGFSLSLKAPDWEPFRTPLFEDGVVIMAVLRTTVSPAYFILKAALGHTWYS